MEITEIISAIAEKGILCIIAGIFLWFIITDRNMKNKEREIEQAEKKEEKANNNAVLKELASSNANIAESLNLLKISIDTNTTEYRQHDERAIEQFANIDNKLTIITEKLNKKEG